MTEWLQPFMMIAAPLLIGSISVQPKKSLRKTFFALIIIACLIFFGYCLVLNYNIRGAGQKMIGIKALTAEGQQRWRQKYGQPLKYVGGEDNLYQWFIIYASDRPHTMQPWDTSEAQPPNVYYRDITAETIKKHGALLLGRKGKDCSQENFTRMSKHWPQFTIEKEAIIYQSEPSADPKQNSENFNPRSDYNRFNTGFGYLSPSTQGYRNFNPNFTPNFTPNYDNSQQCYGNHGNLQSNYGYGNLDKFQRQHNYRDYGSSQGNQNFHRDSTITTQMADFMTEVNGIGIRHSKDRDMEILAVNVIMHGRIILVGMRISMTGMRETKEVIGGGE